MYRTDYIRNRIIPNMIKHRKTPKNTKLSRHVSRQQIITITACMETGITYSIWISIKLLNSFGCMDPSPSDETCSVVHFFVTILSSNCRWHLNLSLDIKWLHKWVNVTWQHPMSRKTFMKYMFLESAQHVWSWLQS